MLELAGRDYLAGKVLLDVANPLDSSQGMPPSLFVSNTDSLGEQIQRAFPEAKVVKALNTMNCQIMVDPTKIPGAHDVFVCGEDEDEDAKRQVTELLQSFGWPPERIRDLGGISSARGTEMYLPLWLRLWGALGTGYFNIAWCAQTRKRVHHSRSGRHARFGHDGDRENGFRRPGSVSDSWAARHSRRRSLSRASSRRCSAVRADAKRRRGRSVPRTR
jgi:hypothetical protein